MYVKMFSIFEPEKLLFEVSHYYHHQPHCHIKVEYPPSISKKTFPCTPLHWKVCKQELFFWIAAGIKAAVASSSTPFLPYQNLRKA